MSDQQITVKGNMGVMHLPEVGVFSFYTGSTGSDELWNSIVLGDTSVHAFTDLGMNVQLFLFLNVLIWTGPMLAAKSG